MTLWWIGDAVLLAVVIPVVVKLLQGLMAPAAEIERTVNALASAGPVLLNDLAPIPELVRTQELVHDTTAGLARYGAALNDIL
jgi:hypothetical protein